MTGERMGAAERARHGSPCRNADLGQPRHDVVQHCGLTAVQMHHPGGVDGEPIRRIGGHDRRVALQSPCRQAAETRLVLLRLGIIGSEVRQ